MGDEVRLWRIGADDDLSEIVRAQLNLESRLEKWLAGDISVLDPDLLVIGRQVVTEFGGEIDLLCIDAAGDLVVVELKRDKTPREITAQVLDYASWVVDLSNERVTSLANGYLGGGFESSFRSKFGTDLPETLNGDHRMVVVGSLVDPSSERIIKYLSGVHGVNINAATFQYFRPADGAELLARVFLIEPSEVDLRSRSKGSSKRRPNLTYEELETLAADAGVAELYKHAVTAFDPLLKKHTTQSSIGFAGNFNGSRKNVISLVPGESSAEQGLSYRVYKHRYAELSGLSVVEAESLMPVSHTHWVYDPNDPEWEGFRGFITERHEIDRMADALKRLEQIGTPRGRDLA